MQWKKYNEDYQYRHVDTTARHWGWEVRMCIQNINGDENGLVIRFNQEPIQEQVNTAMLIRMEQFLIPEPVPEKIYTETEIIDLLKEKEYLTEGQTLDDLKSKTELTAEVK